MIAALFIEHPGVYSGLRWVDGWDEGRDARRYGGPWPVVAHPPCARWCRLAKQVEKRGGLKVGEDGGAFASALASVRKWGGVLEHPACSLAWPHFGLWRPRGLGWQRTIEDEWVAEVYQSAYGHLAEKRTWLFASGIRPLPLRTNRPEVDFVVAGRGRKEMPKRDRSTTPYEFRDLLLAIARTAR